MKIKEYVNKYDPQKQFDVLIDSYLQIEYALNNRYELSPVKGKKFLNIILSGLGGSAISGDVA